MDITDEVKEVADRAFELLEMKSPHQLAVELVELQRKHNIALSALDKLQDQRDGLVFERDRAARALTRAGYTLVDGAQEWKPPISPAASPLLERIDQIAAQLAESTRQSRMKAALDLLKDVGGFFDYVRNEAELFGPEGEQMIDLHDRIDALLTGQVPATAVTVTETILTAPERIWLQVGDQAHYHSEPFPRDTSEVSWCADSVVGCEVPYVRADLACHSPVVPDGWHLVPIIPTQEMLTVGALYPDSYADMLAAAKKAL